MGGSVKTVEIVETVQTVKVVKRYQTPGILEVWNIGMMKRQKAVRLR